jgi:hypothetical protein
MPTPDQPLRISAPFRCTLEIGARAADGPTVYPLSGAGWIGLIRKLAPFAHEVSIDGAEPLQHPEIWQIIGSLERAALRYHITSNVNWNHPRAVLRRLQELRHLSTLRIIATALPSGPGLQANLALAIAAGIKTWCVGALDDTDADAAEAMVRIAVGMGVKGVAFEASAIAAAGRPRVIERLADLRGAGFPVHLEYCGGEESCWVGPTGAVHACRHGTRARGELCTSELTEIWATEAPKDGHDCRQPDVGLQPAPAGPIRLNGDLVPIPLYRARTEPLGAILIKGRDFVPISARG